MTYMDTIKTAQVGVPDSTQPQQAVVPAYMHEVYEWAYLNPRNVEFLDREFIVSLILWGNNQRLIEHFYYATLLRNEYCCRGGHARPEQQIIIITDYNRLISDNCAFCYRLNPYLTYIP